MNKRKDSQGKKRKQQMKAGTDLENAANIYPFDRRGAQPLRSESTLSAKLKQEQPPILEMVEALEAAIKEVESLVNRPGCEYAKILLRMYKWAHAEFVRMMESPAPPDAERIKSVCSLLQIDSEEL